MKRDDERNRRCDPDPTHGVYVWEQRPDDLSRQSAQKHVVRDFKGPIRLRVNARPKKPTCELGAADYRAERQVNTRHPQGAFLRQTADKAPGGDGYYEEPGRKDPNHPALRLLILVERVWEQAMAAGVRRSNSPLRGRYKENSWIDIRKGLLPLIEIKAPSR